MQLNNQEYPAGRLLELRLAVLWLVMALAGWGSAGAQLDPIVAGQLQIQGNRLTIFADELTTDADQTVNVAERARVRTCFGGPQIPCGSILPGDPRIAGLAVVGELRGPELADPIRLETVPGGTFILPGFQQQGDYFLDNIRLVAVATGNVVGFSEPPLALIRVRQIVLARATVRQLTLAELQARGITLTEENFQAFNFAVGFAFEDEIVEIEFPVLFDGNGTVNPLAKGKVLLDRLPADVIQTVRRWQPPRIVPFRLQTPERELLDVKREEQEELVFPLFGAIVIPGTVTYLNQFFDAQLVVANGAPAGSGVTLENLHGAIQLPSGSVLRVAQSDPPAAVGQGVPILRGDGGRGLVAGQQGMANWTVEGLRAGTHLVRMDITGDLVRPGRDPFPVLSRAQAAVEVVDARFNLTFSHPDVVREGEAYTLFVTVANLSQVPQNLVSVEIRQQSLTGAHAEDPLDGLRRTIETLAPGQAETVEYRLVADLTGKVIATTFQSDSSAGQGTILLRAGVGELGIPLSPATLVLPRFSERLKTPHIDTDELLRSNVRLLGLAHSLAVAPAGRIPPGLPRVIKTDVERRAVDLAEAGQRTFLREELLESVEALALDQLGNREALPEFDELRRRTVKGLRAAAQLGSVLRTEQGVRGFDALELFDHFAETTSYASPYLAAIVVPAGGNPVPVLEVNRSVDGGVATLAHPSDDEARAVRTLPFGEIYAVRETAGATATVPFALVGHVDLDHEFEIVLRNDTAAPAAGRLVLLLPDGSSGEYRRVDLGSLTLPALGRVAVTAGAGVSPVGAGGFRFFDPQTDLFLSGAPTPLESAVPLPPFRLIGAVQDFRLAEEGPDQHGNMIRPNRYGNGLSYLFNRPPDPVAAERPESYRIRSTWSGLDVIGEPASGVSEKLGLAAFFQTTSERVVNVRYSSPIASLIDVDGTPLIDHEHLLDTSALVDAKGNPLSTPVPLPSIESVPLHVGGLVDGRVVRGTGEGVVGAKVELVRPRIVQTSTGTRVKLDLVGESLTDPDGRFYFDFVESPSWDRQVARNFVLRALVPPGADPVLEPATKQEVSTFIRQQNRLAHVNIALLGRGTVTGTLVYLDTQEPVVGGRVTAASTLFDEVEAVDVAEDGSFALFALPVGPITLTGRDDRGRRVYATVGIERPGDAIDVRLEIQRATTVPGLGTVLGKVVRKPPGDPLGESQDVPGARVAIYSEGRIVSRQMSDEFGNFRFDEVPEGRVSLQAADFRISRTSVFTDLVLAAGETVDVTLTLPDNETRTVSGTVQFFDPLTNSQIPIAGAVAFIEGPGVFAHTDSQGLYRIEGVPVQGTSDGAYEVTAIDFERKLQGVVKLPPVLDASPDEILAQPIVLRQMRGGIDGVVLDPLGRPIGNAGVVLLPFAETLASSDGSFSFNDIPVGTWTVATHVAEGLDAGRVGFLGQATTRIVFGGHRPFLTVRMRGSGVVTVHTRTATSTGVLTPIFYRPTYFSLQAKEITLRGQFIETTTDPNGRLELVLPVGAFELVAFNPFHGIKEIKSKLSFQGQVKNIEVVFAETSIVKGQVVDVDGLTPVADIPVKLHTRTLKPQTLLTDAQGNFQFELVPKGGVVVTAKGFVGTVERVGRAHGVITRSGQTLELQLPMKAQGTVRGQVLEQVGGDLLPLANAQIAVKENSYPYRRLPQRGTFFVTDSEGRYEVSHIHAGRVTVVARDSFQVTRRGSTSGSITADWQVLDLPDIVMRSASGSVTVMVRDQETGGPVADAQVRLSNGEVTVSDAEGVAIFDALKLQTYSVYAFFAPTGQSGRVRNLRLTSDGQEISTTVFLDQRGEVLGTLFDDAAFLFPVAGGTVSLSGSTSGGKISALATTSGVAESQGRFSFLGIPEGSFSLTAALQDSARRAHAQVDLTETAPIADINMVLEPVGDVYVRLFEKLTAGRAPIDTDAGIFSVRLTQTASGSSFKSYDFTRLASEPGTDVFFFPDVLTERRVSLRADELGGEQRSKKVSIGNLLTSNPLVGSGTLSDPYQLVLSAKGVVRVTVLDALNNTVPGANATLRTGSGTRFPSVTGADGSVTFFAVPAGSLTASATSPASGFGGVARGSLTFDDEVVELQVSLAPAVSAHGIVFQPLPEDRTGGEGSELLPQPGAIVEIRDSRGDLQVVVTGGDGTFRFEVLPIGGFTLSAQNVNGDQLATASGTLVGPDGTDNALPILILDASPPRILSIVPPPGLEDVSRTAPVEIIFSEPLAAAVVPTGQSTSPFFKLRSASGQLATGTWSSSLSQAGEQVVRFVPSEPYDNVTIYSLTLVGGTNGIRDRVDRPVTPSGNVGSNFKTSDSIGPRVISTEPALDVPVDPAGAIRIDFNEAVVATNEQLDGDGAGDTAQLFALKSDNSAVALPVTLFLTRGDFSLVVVPVQGLEILDDSGRRRLQVSGLSDVFGNLMPPFEIEYRTFDDSAPVLVDVPFPDGAPTGELNQGRSYFLTPVLTNVDDATPENPGGDIERVEYFLSDPADPTNPTQPAFSALRHPFRYSFIGAYSGNGIDPRPFPVWVRAVDTSTNTSNVVQVAMEVLPNMPPTVGSVSSSALLPVPGIFYAGSRIQARVTGFDDPDGNQLTVSADLFEEGALDPTDSVPGRALTQPATGWADAGAQTFEMTIPLDLPEGAPLFVQATVIDSQGGVATVESLPFTVADDVDPPSIDSVVAKRTAGSADLVFFIGDDFFVELRARDLETAVESVEVTLDRADLFPDPLTAALVAGRSDLYRTSTLTVPSSVAAASDVTFTVRANDLGLNTGERTLTVQVAPEPDPTAPTAEWVTPWQGAPWPANYASVIPAQGGVPLLLRARVQDTNLDAGGLVVPGTIVDVRFRGPVAGAGGALELATIGTPATLVPGTEGPGQGVFEVLWIVPENVPLGSEIPFSVEAFDSGGKSVLRTVTMTAEPRRKVYEGVLSAILPDDPMLAPDGDERGLVFLIGSTLSLFEQSNGTVRELPGVVLFTSGEIVGGGELEARPSVLTAPEITSYSSAILFHPLELSLETLFAVGDGSRVDVAERGLLGSTATESLLLPGERNAEPHAGGSHGGSGWFGSAGSGGWDRLNLRQPGSVYDSLRDPKLPGGGGASNGSNPGGAGGGVVRLFSPQGTVRLIGDVLASGGQGSGGGGAGGSIRLVAGRLEGQGRLEASGGDGKTAEKSGGGGGGRVSVSFGELAPAVDLGAQINVRGGQNAGATVGNPQPLGGAGTLYLETLDTVTGQAAGPGELRILNHSGVRAATTPLPALGDGSVFMVDPAASTVTLDVPGVQGDLVGDELVLERDTGEPLGVFPILTQTRRFDATAASFRVELGVAASESELLAVLTELVSNSVRFHGRTRLLAVAVSGTSRLVVDDDLVVGAAGDPMSALNDRSRVSPDAEARFLLRGEVPVVSAAAGEPSEGADVRLGSTVEVTWTADDLLGFDRSTEGFSTVETTRVYGDEPLTIMNLGNTGAGETLAVTLPVDTPPGLVSYSIAVRDLGGRTASTELVWNVLPNEPPTATLSGPAIIQAGGSATISVRADDVEGLAEVTLLASGPVNEPSQTITTSGLTRDVDFTISVPAGADGSTPVAVEAVVVDIVGDSATTSPLTLSVIPNAAASGNVALAVGEPAAFKPGRSTTVVVHAEDPDGLETIELLSTGPVTEPSQTLTVGGAVVDASFTITAQSSAAVGPLAVTARLIDVFGIAFETAPLALEIIDNALPSGSVAFAAGTPAAVLPGTTVTVLVHAEDDEGLDQIVLNATGPVAIPSQSEVVTGSLVDVSFPVTIDLTALSSQSVSVSAEIFDAFGAPATVTDSLSLGILDDIQAPLVAVSGVRSSYAAGETLVATIESSDDVATSRLEITFDGQSHTVLEPGESFEFSIEVDRTLTATRSTVFAVTARDFADNPSTPVQVPVDLRPDLAPTFALDVGSGTELLPGAILEATVTASDDVAIATITFTLSGATSQQSVRPVDATEGNEVFQHALPVTLQSGDPLNLFVEVVDSFGHIESDTVSLTILADTEAPTLGIELIPTAPTDTYTSGDVVTVRATAQDNVAVETLSLTVDDQTVTGPSPLDFVWTVPGVSGPTAFDLVAEATDPAGNPATLTRTVAVDPVFDPDRPTLEILCPSGGALLAPGTGIDVQVDAADDQGLEKVEFFVDDDPTPVSTDVEAPYTFRLDAPAGALEGESLRLRVVATDFGTKSAEASVDVKIVEGTILTANTTLAADDFSLDGLSVIVAGGTLTITGPHTFRDLVVLAGGTVVHPETTASTEHRLELTLFRDLYVGCGGLIDGRARGYRAGGSSSTGRSFPNSTAEGATSGLGGSHGGRGGRFAGRTLTYGNVFDPRDLGGGGGGANFSSPDGGGAVRINASGAVVVDGVVRANGGTTTSGQPGAAGGSIRLDASSISGRGSITASGTSLGTPGASGNASAGGGGGRIALYAATIDDTLLATGVRAHGGGSMSASRVAAPGTLYVRRDEQAFGDLIVDNRGFASPQVAELLPVRSGVIDQVTAGTITDFEADFRHSLVGAEVAFNGDLTQLWTIIDHDHHGQTLVLDVTQQPLPVQAGDIYQGVYRFDRVIVRGSSVAVAQDVVLTTEQPEVEAGSGWLPNYQPTVTLTGPGEGSIFNSGESLTLSADVEDVLGFDEVSFEINGETFIDSAAPFAVSVAAPVVLDATDFEVRAAVNDYVGNQLSDTLSITVNRDNVPPTVTLELSPEVAADTYSSGDVVIITATASDNLGVDTVTLTVNGQETSGPSPVIFSFTAPAVSTAMPFDVEVEASDIFGNLGTASRTLTVEPIDDPDRPTIQFLCPTDGALLPPGRGIDVEVEATDNLGVEKVEFFLNDDPTPVLTDVMVPYTYRLEASVAAVEGEILRLRAVVSDFGGQSTAAEILVGIVEGVFIASDTVLGASDLSLEGQTVILDEGVTLTVDGLHTFRDLVILGGGTVDHSPQGALELSLSRDLYVACRASLDATGLGFSGAPVGELGGSFAVGEGAGEGIGGSHGGRGGLFGSAADASSLYGNLFDPSDPGAGGGFSATTPGLDGGGVVHLDVTGRAVVDGDVLANGQMVGGAAPGAPSPNLITNAGNDEPLVAGEIPGWTEVIGTTWFQRMTNPAPESGVGYFAPGAGPEHELRQDVDVSTMASRIDAGGQEFAFSGFVRTFDQSNPDFSRIVLEYQDAGGGVLTSFDSGEIAVRTEWLEVRDERVAPVGTRRVRIRLISRRRSGTQNDGYYDSLALRAPDLPSGGAGGGAGGSIRIVAGELSGGGRLEASGSESSGPFAGFPSVNLLTNPGAEELVVGELTGWVEVEGTTWTQRAASPRPHSGVAYFLPGDGPSHKLRQDVDVSAFVDSIDRGQQKFVFSGFVRSFNQTPADLSRIVVEYRDATGAALESFDSGEIGSLTSWVEVRDERFAPVGTRAVRVRLLSRRQSGVQNDGYYDSLSLRALGPPAGGGGGGRIGLYATSMSEGLLARTSATGAQTASSIPEAWGSAGTIFVLHGGQSFGDLILNNRGVASAQPTELLAVGSGTVDQATASSITDLNADFLHSLAGAEVAINGDFSQPFLITGNQHHGQTLDLDVSQVSLVAGLGDTYEGIYRFDRVFLRGSVIGVSSDVVLTSEAAEVAAGSQWLPGYEPAVTLTSPSPAAVFTSGQDVAMSALVDDVLGVVAVHFTLDGQTFVDTTPPYAVTVPAPVVSQATAFDARALVFDLSGNEFSTSVSITVQP